jgi:hypothetical protein
MRAANVSIACIIVAVLLFVVAGVFVLQNVAAQTEQERINTESMGAEVTQMIPIPHPIGEVRAILLYGLILFGMGILTGVYAALSPLPNSTFARR